MQRNKLSVAVLYALFAGLSILTNISVQVFSVRVYGGPYSVEVSILMGTLAGLPLRYFLEKRYIFAYKSKTLTHGGWIFIVYSFMGVITTAIFWGVEYSFYIFFHSDVMRYLGGCVGLGIGSYVKYQLDKKFVFVNYDSKVSM